MQSGDGTAPRPGGCYFVPGPSRFALRFGLTRPGHGETVGGRTDPRLVGSTAVGRDDGRWRPPDATNGWGRGVAKRLNLKIARLSHAWCQRLIRERNFRHEPEHTTPFSWLHKYVAWRTARNSCHRGYLRRLHR